MKLFGTHIREVIEMFRRWKNPPSTTNAKEVIGYMDMVDWQHEIGQAPGGVEVYLSVEDLKEYAHTTGWQQKKCGIVKVKVAWLEDIEPQDP